MIPQYYEQKQILKALKGETLKWAESRCQHSSNLIDALMYNDRSIKISYGYTHAIAEWEGGQWKWTYGNISYPNEMLSVASQVCAHYAPLFK